MPVALISHDIIGESLQDVFEISGSTSCYITISREWGNSKNEPLFIRSKEPLGMLSLRETNWLPLSELFSGAHLADIDKEDRKALLKEIPEFKELVAKAILKKAESDKAALAALILIRARRSEALLRALEANKPAQQLELLNKSRRRYGQ